MMQKFQRFFRAITAPIDVALLAIFWNKMTPANRDRAMTDINKAGMH